MNHILYVTLLCVLPVMVFGTDQETQTDQLYSDSSDVSEGSSEQDEWLLPTDLLKDEPESDSPISMIVLDREWHQSRVIQQKAELATELNSTPTDAEPSDRQLFSQQMEKIHGEAMFYAVDSQTQESFMLGIFDQVKPIGKNLFECTKDKTVSILKFDMLEDSFVVSREFEAREEKLEDLEDSKSEIESQDQSYGGLSDPQTTDESMNVHFSEQSSSISNSDINDHNSLSGIQHFLSHQGISESKIQECFWDSPEFDNDPTHAPFNGLLKITQITGTKPPSAFANSDNMDWILMVDSQAAQSDHNDNSPAIYPFSAVNVHNKKTFNFGNYEHGLMVSPSEMVFVKSHQIFYFRLDIETGQRAQYKSFTVEVNIPAGSWVGSWSMSKSLENSHFIRWIEKDDNKHTAEVLTVDINNESVMKQEFLYGKKMILSSHGEILIRMSDLGLFVIDVSSGQNIAQTMVKYDIQPPIMSEDLTYLLLSPVDTTKELALFNLKTNKLTILPETSNVIKMRWLNDEIIQLLRSNQQPILRCASNPAVNILFEQQSNNQPTRSPATIDAFTLFTSDDRFRLNRKNWIYDRQQDCLVKVRWLRHNQFVDPVSTRVTFWMDTNPDTIIQRTMAGPDWIKMSVYFQGSFYTRFMNTVTKQEFSLDKSVNIMVDNAWMIDEQRVIANKGHTLYLFHRDMNDGTRLIQNGEISINSQIPDDCSWFVDPQTHSPMLFWIEENSNQISGFNVNQGRMVICDTRLPVGQHFTQIGSSLIVTCDRTKIYIMDVRDGSQLSSGYIHYGRFDNRYLSVNISPDDRYVLFHMETHIGNYQFTQAHLMAVEDGKMVDMKELRGCTDLSWINHQVFRYEMNESGQSVTYLKSVSDLNGDPVKSIFDWNDQSLLNGKNIDISELPLQFPAVMLAPNYLKVGPRIIRTEWSD